MNIRTYFISYDITDNYLRKKIASFCETHGVRRQKSLYEVNLTNCEKNYFEITLCEKLQEQDKLFLRPVCNKCYEKTYFQGSIAGIIESEKFWVI